MGSDAAGRRALCDVPGITRDAQPIHRVSVDGFWMDATEVTNAQFAAFVKATGYVTIAERPPDPADFPGAPPEVLVPGSAVFTPPVDAVRSAQRAAVVAIRAGRELASSRRTRQRSARPRALSGRARRVCRCRGVRGVGRPAAADRSRMGIRRARRAVGEPLRVGQRAHAARRAPAPTFTRARSRCTTTGADGFAGRRAGRAVSRRTRTGSSTSPATSGNGSSDWYRPDYYAHARRGRRRRRAIRAAPTTRSIRRSPARAKRVQRGGSFLCTDQYCSRYMVGTRGKSEVSTGSNHVGFRTVKSR